MYPVSDAYKEAIESNTRKYFWTGTITDKNQNIYEFTNQEIVKGSGYITRQCCGNTEIELGTVYAAEMGISLFCDIDRYTLEDAEVKLWFHLELPDGSEEAVPMGVFYVAEANRQRKTIELKAYDCMLNLEKSFDKGLSSATPYEFLALLAKACHIQLAQSQEEIEALTNGKELFGIYQENDIESWRDFLYYLAQAMGCFATIDRNGKLLLVPYGKDSSKTVDSRHRFTSSFSDFVTRYTAINSTNKRTEMAEYYAKKPDDGLTMNLGVNPLLQFGLDETRKRILNGILDAISMVEYVPFDSDMIGDPAMDLGDVLRFTGGHADETKQAAVTSIHIKINGKQTIKCVGKNPRLSEAKSKTDKNISGLLNSINDRKLSVYTYTNALAVEVGDGKVSIINIEFASGEETNAEFHAEAILQVQSKVYARTTTAQATIDVGTATEDKKVISFPVNWEEDGRAGITVFYVLDGHEVEQFHPEETWFSGKHLLNLYYPIIELEENQLHTFEVLISMTNGTATIDTQNIMATITGQGLGVQERWDGRITADEMMQRIVLSGMPLNPFRESLTVKVMQPTQEGLQSRISAIAFTGMPLHPIRETLSLFSPIVHDVITVDDRKKMVYDKNYVLDNGQFFLQTEYEISGGTQSRLDRGRMIRLTIPTVDFSSLTGLEILPFDTLPFVNMKVLYATNLSNTDYTKLEDNVIGLKKECSVRIKGVDAEIDRGRLAVFDLNIKEMEAVEELEVTNA